MGPLTLAEQRHHASAVVLVACHWLLASAGLLVLQLQQVLFLWLTSGTLLAGLGGDAESICAGTDLRDDFGAAFLRVLGAAEPGAAPPAAQMATCSVEDMPWREAAAQDGLLLMLWMLTCRRRATTGPAARPGPCGLLHLCLLALTRAALALVETKSQ